MNKLTLAFPALALAALLAGPGGLQAQASPATLRPNPATLEIGEGQIETLVFVLENAQDAYGIDVRGRFDPQVVEIVAVEANAPLRAGGFIKPDFVAINTANNVSGTFQWAATQVNPTAPASGSGPIISIQFRGKRRGASTPIEITFVELAGRTGNSFPVTRQSGAIVIVAPRPIAAGSTPAPGALATSVLTPGPGNVPAPTVAQIATQAATGVAPIAAGPALGAVPAASSESSGSRDLPAVIFGGIVLIGLLAVIVLRRRPTKTG